MRCCRRPGCYALFGVSSDWSAHRFCSCGFRRALIAAWAAADRICGKRLKAILPDLAASLERRGHLAPTPVCGSAS